MSETARQVASVVADVVIGPPKAAVEIITGVDIFTGEKLSGAQRAIAAVGLIPLVGGAGRVTAKCAKATFTAATVKASARNVVAKSVVTKPTAAAVAMSSRLGVKSVSTHCAASKRVAAKRATAPALKRAAAPSSRPSPPAAATPPKGSASGFVRKEPVIHSPKFSTKKDALEYTKRMSDHASRRLPRQQQNKAMRSSGSYAAHSGKSGHVHPLKNGAKDPKSGVHAYWGNKRQQRHPAAKARMSGMGGGRHKAMAAAAVVGGLGGAAAASANAAAQNSSDLTMEQQSLNPKGAQTNDKSGGKKAAATNSTTAGRATRHAKKAPGSSPKRRAAAAVEKEPPSRGDPSGKQQRSRSATEHGRAAIDAAAFSAGSDLVAAAVGNDVNLRDAALRASLSGGLAAANSVATDGLSAGGGLGDALAGVVTVGALDMAGQAISSGTVDPRTVAVTSVNAVLHYGFDAGFGARLHNDNLQLMSLTGGGDNVRMVANGGSVSIPTSVPFVSVGIFGENVQVTSSSADGSRTESMTAKGAGMSVSAGPATAAVGLYCGTSVCTKVDETPTGTTTTTRSERFVGKPIARVAIGRKGLVAALPAAYAKATVQTVHEFDAAHQIQRGTVLSDALPTANTGAQSAHQETVTHKAEQCRVTDRAFALMTSRKIDDVCDRGVALDSTHELTSQVAPDGSARVCYARTDDTSTFCDLRETNGAEWNYFGSVHRRAPTCFAPGERRTALHTGSAKVTDVEWFREDGAPLFRESAIGDDAAGATRDVMSTKTVTREQFDAARIKTATEMDKDSVLHDRQWKRHRDETSFELRAGDGLPVAKGRKIDEHSDASVLRRERTENGEPLATTEVDISKVHVQLETVDVTAADGVTALRTTHEGTYADGAREDVLLRTETSKTTTVSGQDMAAAESTVESTALEQGIVTKHSRTRVESEDFLGLTSQHRRTERTQRSQFQRDDADGVRHEHTPEAAVTIDETTFDTPLVSFKVTETTVEGQPPEEKARKKVTDISPGYATKRAAGAAIGATTAQALDALFCDDGKSGAQRAAEVASSTAKAGALAVVEKAAVKVTNAAVAVVKDHVKGHVSAGASNAAVANSSGVSGSTAVGLGLAAAVVEFATSTDGSGAAGIKATGVGVGAVVTAKAQSVISEAVRQGTTSAAKGAVLSGGCAAGVGLIVEGASILGDWYQGKEVTGSQVAERLGTAAISGALSTAAAAVTTSALTAAASSTAVTGFISAVGTAAAGGSAAAGATATAIGIVGPVVAFAAPIVVAAVVGWAVTKICKWLWNWWTARQRKKELEVYFAVSSSVDEATLASVVRRKALTCHPDKGFDKAKFNELQEKHAEYRTLREFGTDSGKRELGICSRAFNVLSALWASVQAVAGAGLFIEAVRVVSGEKPRDNVVQVADTDGSLNADAHVIRMQPNGPATYLQAMYTRDRRAAATGFTVTFEPRAAGGSGFSFTPQRDASKKPIRGLRLVHAAVGDILTGDDAAFFSPNLCPRVVTSPVFLVGMA